MAASNIEDRGLKGEGVQGLRISGFGVRGLACTTGVEFLGHSGFRVPKPYTSRVEGLQVQELCADLSEHPKSLDPRPLNPRL